MQLAGNVPGLPPINPSYVTATQTGIFYNEDRN